MLPLLWACAPDDPPLADDPPDAGEGEATGDDSAADTDTTPPASQPPPPLPSARRRVTDPMPQPWHPRGTPVACEGAILAATAGHDAAEALPADVHAAVEGADPAPRQVHTGWTGDPATGITLLWRTDADTLTTQVQLGEAAGAYTATVDGASFLVEDADTAPRVHEVRVCGLTWGTTWHYRVGGGNTWSEDFTFTTAPDPGSREPIVFGVAGDTRGDPTTWSQVLAGMASHGVEFRLFTGDAVGTGARVDEWDDWFDAGAGYVESVPTINAHGNHEYQAQAYFALVGLPGNERWFSVDYGNVHFAFVDDEPAYEEDWQAQAEWLAADLAATTQPWKIVVHHQPGFSSSLVHATSADVLEWFVPVQEAGGVDVDFAGHNHHYERTVPIRDGAQDATGVTYVITAGGGAPLYDNDAEEWYTDVAVVTEHYTIVRVDDDVLTLVAYDLAGNVLDTWVKQK
ncbi:MAG: fibronectin type III domain-containing protein [Myxococcota bacterium]